MEININIPQAVGQLLFQRDKVVVPHFGTFVCHTRPSVVDVERNTMTPPCRTVAFDSQEREDDGVLVSHLVQRLGVQRDVVVREMKLYVSACVADMVLGRKVAFEGIGEFAIAGEEIVFEPYADANFDSNSFGLTSLVARPVARNKEYGEGIRENRIRIRRMYVRRAVASVAAVLLLAVGFYALLRYDAQVNDSNYASMLPFFYSSPNECFIRNFDEQLFGVGNKTETNLEAAEVTENEDVAAVEEVQPAELEAAVTEPADEVPSDDVEETVLEQPVETVSENTDAPTESAVVEASVPEKQYYVIAGSFATAANAERFVKELEGKGFAPVVVEKNGKWRVAYAESTGKEKALELLERMRSEQDPSSWLIAK